MKKVFKLITAPIVLLFKTLNGAREFIEDRLADVLDCVGREYEYFLGRPAVP